MTAERKAELRKLAEAATPGPWTPMVHNAAAPIGATAVSIWPVEGSGKPSIATLPPGHAETDAAYIVAAATAIPELLDELEAAQKEIVTFLTGRNDAADRERERADSLAARVVRLRDMLDTATEALACDDTDDAKAFVAESEALLADTEAAATTWLEAHDREQRAVGARELVERVRARGILDAYTGDHAGVTFTSMTDALAAMEREARQ